MPKKKYFTEEERRAARLAANKKYNHTHRINKHVKRERTEYMKEYAKNPIHQEKAKKVRREWNKRNPDSHKNWDCNNKERRLKNLRSSHLKRVYNITLKEYNEMFVNQSGCCAICGRHQSELKQALGVDHSHKTRKIRGLLCRACNISLGGFRDNTEILYKAINYLKKQES